MELAPGKPECLMSGEFGAVLIGSNESTTRCLKFYTAAPDGVAAIKRGVRSGHVKGDRCAIVGDDAENRRLNVEPRVDVAYGENWALVVAAAKRVGEIGASVGCQYERLRVIDLPCPPMW